jgi:hypothetical protein
MEWRPAEPNNRICAINGDSCNIVKALRHSAPNKTFLLGASINPCTRASPLISQAARRFSLFYDAHHSPFVLSHAP